MTKPNHLFHFMKFHKQRKYHFSDIKGFYFIRSTSFHKEDPNDVCVRLIWEYLKTRFNLEGNIEYKSHIVELCNEVGVVCFTASDHLWRGNVRLRYDYKDIENLVSNTSNHITVFDKIQYMDLNNMTNCLNWALNYTWINPNTGQPINGQISIKGTNCFVPENLLFSCCFIKDKRFEKEQEYRLIRSTSYLPLVPIKAVSYQHNCSALYGKKINKIMSGFGIPSEFSHLI